VTSSGRVTHGQGLDGVAEQGLVDHIHGPGRHLVSAAEVGITDDFGLVEPPLGEQQLRLGIDDSLEIDHRPGDQFGAGGVVTGNLETGQRGTCAPWRAPGKGIADTEGGGFIRVVELPVGGNALCHGVIADDIAGMLALQHAPVAKGAQAKKAVISGVSIFCLAGSHVVVHKATGLRLSQSGSWRLR